MTTDNWHNAGRNSWLSVSKQDEKFLLKINTKSSTLYTDFQEAAAYNAECIRTDFADKDLYVMLSGGLDSEFVADTLLKQNIAFTPIIMDFGDLNRYEKWYADYWCHTNNVKPIVLTFSKEEMLKQIFAPYMKYMPKHSHYYATLITLFVADYVEQRNGVCLTGLADPNWNLERKEFFCDYVDFPLDIHRPGKHPSGFFIYTPEITLSYAHQFNTELDEQYNKINFYKVSPRVKYNYAYDFSEFIPEFGKITKLREQSMKQPTPHWYGSKQEFINQLI